MKTTLTQQELSNIIRFFSMFYVTNPILINENINIDGLETNGFKFIKNKQIKGIVAFSKEYILNGLDILIKDYFEIIDKYFELNKYIKSKNQQTLFDVTDSFEKINNIKYYSIENNNEDISFDNIITIEIK
jgi:hypothetical protein